jgi:hypothetical protein
MQAGASRVLHQHSWQAWGFTPINIALSDIRPMVRAELKKIRGLPKGGDALTAPAHYADLRFRLIL